MLTGINLCLQEEVEFAVSKAMQSVGRQMLKMEECAAEEKTRNSQLSEELG